MYTYINTTIIARIYNRERTWAESIVAAVVQTIIISSGDMLSGFDGQTQSSGQCRGLSTGAPVFWRPGTDRARISRLRTGTDKKFVINSCCLR